jgi:hypothetical protein
MPTTREARFIAKSKGSLYTVFCSKCSASKSLGSNKGHSLPPKIIIKKLERAGWVIGNKPKDDICPECARKPIKSHAALASKALKDMAAGMVNIGDNHKIHFGDLLRVAATLNPEQAKQVIEACRARIPQRPRIPRKPKPEPRSNDRDYERWLEEADRNLSNGAAK